jgi:hypothetical protein
LTSIERLTRELEDDLCTSLSETERRTLTRLLRQIVSQQNITPAVHPAYRKLQHGKEKR